MTRLLSPLARSLNEQRDITGPLSFDEKLAADIRASALKHDASFTTDDLDVFVSALDVGDPTKVQRLDAASAEFLCFVLIHSEPCRPQQRGLHLLAAAIHTEQFVGLKVQRSSTRRAMRPRLSDLLNMFDSDTGYPELTRRYAAVLAIEILPWSKMTADTLSNVKRKDLWPLGHTLTTASSYSLRQLAGILIHRLNLLAVPEKSLFATAELAISFKNAIPSNAHYSQMLGGLTNFFKEGSDHRSLPIAFTSHVAIGHKSFVTGEQAGIMISISKELGVLTISIPPSPDKIAVYIDVPFENAELHNLRLSTKEEAQKKYVIGISLGSRSQASLSINASLEDAQQLNLGYTSKKSADDAYLTLKSMLSESTSPTEIGKPAYAEPWNKFSNKIQYSVSSRGESEISADLRKHSEALSKDMESDVPFGKGIDEDLVECASTSPAVGSTVLDGDSDGVLYGDTASEFTDQDRSETRGIAESALYNHDQHSDTHGGSGSDKAQANDVASSSPNSVKEQSEIQRSRGERPSSLEHQTPIEVGRRSPTTRRKAPWDPALPTKAGPKKQGGVKASARHTKPQVIGGAEISDEMWDVGLEIEAEPGPINLQSKHVSQREEHPPKVGAMPFRPSEPNEIRAEQARAEKTGKSNAASKSIGAKKASTRIANTENANIGKSRTGTTRKGDRCIEQTEREVASSPVADAAKESTLPRRSKRAAATQAQRKIEDQVSSEEASDDALMSSSWEPKAEEKRARKATPNRKSSGKHNSTVKNHHSQAKEHKARIVPLPTNTMEHEPESEPQDNAASDHSPDYNSLVTLPNRDNQPSKSAQNPGGSRSMPITNSTRKRKATTVEALPAKRKKVAIVERASKIRLRDDQKLQPTTPRTKSQRKAPLIHFTKHGPQNSGLLKPLNRKSNLPVVQSTPRRPLAATAGNLSTPVLPYKGTEETTTSSANLPPCRESTPEYQPPGVGSQTRIANNGSPIPVGDFDSTSIQDENSPPREEESVVTPDRPGNKTEVYEQAHTKKLAVPLETRNPFGSDGPARKTTFMDRLQASNNRQRREHNQGQRQDSMRPVATVQLGQQVEPMHEEPALWEDADTTVIEPEPDLHRDEHTLRQQDETSSSSSAFEDAALLKQFGEQEPRQGKVSMALMEAAKQIDKYQRSKDARILEKFHHFQAYGEGLVQGFTKACQAELESHEEKLKRAAKDVKDSEKKLKSAKEVVKTWQREQEKMFVDIQALMAEGGE